MMRECLHLNAKSPPYGLLFFSSVLHSGIQAALSAQLPSSYPLICLSLCSLINTAQGLERWLSGKREH
ncbi:rCG61660 [Rattus norvegicus]|uniref:RCG61660 n=1 Tax=Rattus norvegicus TaxID=10116 RepID=A6HB76_RAT|nr:rCG61660 [Rattus norvegicus]